MFCLADRTRLFVQYAILLSSLCKIIWRHWTYKMPVRDILSFYIIQMFVMVTFSAMDIMGDRCLRRVKYTRICNLIDTMETKPNDSVG